MSSAAPAITAPAAPSAPSTATATPAPAPVAQTPSADPYDAIFDAHDGVTTAPPDASTPEAEVAPIEAPKEAPAEQTPEQKQQAEIEAKLPEKFRDSIKDIKDSKVRKALAADHFKAKALTDSGLRIGELQERAKLAPTLEIAQHHKAVYDDVVALNDAFQSGTPEGQQRFADALRSNSPEAFVQFLETSFRTLPKSFPAVARKFSNHVGKNMIAWARQRSAEVGDPDIAAAADIFESTFKLGSEEAQPVAEPVDDPRLQKLEEYERQEAERAAASRQTFLDSAYNLAGGTAFKELTNWVDTAFPNANQQGKAWVVEQVGRAVYQEVVQNRDLAEQLKRVVASTQDQEEGRQAIARSILNFIRQKSPAIRAQKGKEFRDMTRTERVQKEARTAQVLAQREVGAGGTVTKLQTPKPVQKPGQDPYDAIFDAFDAGSLPTRMRSR